jgi:hypothetical protein
MSAEPCEPLVPEEDDPATRPEPYIRPVPDPEDDPDRYARPDDEELSQLGVTRAAYTWAAEQLKHNPISPEQRERLRHLLAPALPQGGS